MIVPLERLRLLLVSSILFVIPLVFWPWSRDAYRVVKEAGMAVYALPALVLWLSAKRPGLERVPAWYLGALGGFLVWILFRAAGTEDSSAALQRAAEWLLVLAAAAGAAGMRPEAGRRAAGFLVAGTALACLLGLAQHLFGSGVLVPYEVDPRSVTFTEERSFSTFGNPIFFASYLVLVFPVTLALILEEGGAGIARRILLYAAAGLQIVALALTSSRGAILGLAGGMAYLALRSRKARRRLIHLAAASLFVVAGAAAIRPALARHMIHPRDPGRLIMWRAAAKMWAQAPLLGAGLGQFARRYPCVLESFATPEEASLGANAWHAHNEYLQAGAETGLPGFLLLAVLIAGLVLLPAHDLTGRAAQAGVCAAGINALFNFPLHIPPIQAFVWMLPAILICTSSGPAAWPAPASGASGLARLRPYAWGLLALAAVALLRPFIRSAYVQRGLAYQSAKRYAKAELFYGRAAELLPDSAGERVSFYRGKSLFEAGDLVAAQAQFEADRERFPCHPEGYGNLGVIYGVRAMRGETAALAKAQELVQRAIALRPGGPEAAGNFNSLGNLRILAGDEEGALAAYRRALELNPGFVEGAANLVRLLVKRGETAEARSVLRETAEHNADDRDLKILARQLGLVR